MRLFMWSLVLYVGVAFTLNQAPVGGPTTAGDFRSKEACEAALSQIKASFGEDRGFDRRFQLEGTPGVDAQTRIWTIKGVCVAKP